MAKLKFKKGEKKLLVVIVITIIILIIGLFFLYLFIDEKLNGSLKYLNIELNGKEEIILKWNEDIYTDEGAKASYRNEDITGDIVVENNVNYEKVGTYKYTYKIKYKKVEKTIERTIKVIDDVKPEIKLLGSENTFMTVGSSYRELGVKATDNYDGDLTSKVVVDTSEIDKNKVGSYKVHYRITDSNGNESVVDRVVDVKEKGPDNQKVAVLNYHFFYKDQKENKEKCGSQGICLQIDKFKEQLKYLKDNGYTTLTIDEFVSWMYGELDIPNKSVLITIDDGGWGTSIEKGNHLIPALEEYKVNATLFLIAGWWEKSNYESEYLDIESHTWNLHYGGNCGYKSKVNCVSYKELLDDLHKSAVVLGSHQAFCFPFYDYTDQSIKAVKEEGFKVAFIGGNRKASRSDDKYKIPRYPISDTTTMSQFINMVQ